jgi:hypothetical protein
MANGAASVSNRRVGSGPHMIPTRARTHPHRLVMQHAFMQSHLLSALALGFAEAVSIVSTCGLWHRGWVDANSDLVPAQWREGVSGEAPNGAFSCVQHSNQLKRLLCSQRTTTLTAPLTQTKIPTRKAALWAAAGWLRDTFNHGRSDGTNSSVQGPAFARGLELSLPLPQEQASQPLLTPPWLP